MNLVPMHSRALAIAALAIALLAIGWLMGIGTTQSPALTQDPMLEFRANYRLAMRDLKAQRYTSFRKRQAEMADYVLAPYLDFHYHRVRANRLSAKQVTDFQARYPDFLFSDRLRNAWLLRLPERGLWNDYLAHYVDSSNTTRRCYYVRALYRSGEKKAALDLVAPLWIAGRSQPKACDSLFKTWIDAGYLTDDHVWQRIQLALPRNEITLARYLLTLLEPGSPLKAPADALYQAQVDPEKFRFELYREDNPTNRILLTRAISRLAGRNAEAAYAHWQRYELSHRFTDEQRDTIERAVLLENAGDNRFPVPTERPQSLDPTTTERLALAAVRNANWPEVSYWIDQLSPEQRDDAQWQYWLAEGLNNTVQDSQRAMMTLEDLALTRSYYGFLAAEEAGKISRLNHTPTTAPEETIAEVARVPGIQRALELYAVDDSLNGRREWNAAFPKLTEEQQRAAALLAQRNGWLNQAITAANMAQLRDDLDLRFPIAHLDVYRKASLATSIPVSTLLAITRQESAFQRKARSSANARGLMQLLYTTATETAKKSGLRRPSRTDLYEPTVNIRIASEYLARLLERYDGQRPLAFAAYNAGPHRVDVWIKDREGMPMTQWIENIPFRETRNYVKGVLAFDHLYGLRMDTPRPMLASTEQTLPTVQ